MLLPSIFGDNFFGENFFDDFMNMPFGGMKTNGMMKTDIRDSGDGYQLEIDMPGFRKEDIKAQLKDGCLTISAATDSSNDEKDKNGSYIRRERYSGTCTRNFYVGEGITQEDIKAKFENGILTLSIPKTEAKPQLEEKSYIAIEG